MNTLQTGIMRLLRSGLTGEQLSMPEEFSLEEAFPVLRKHAVAALAYQGAVNCGLDRNDPTMRKLLMLYYRLLLAHEKQARALDVMFAAFEEAEIAYMPVKGCNLKQLYPKPELRPMGDADVLIRLEDYDRIFPIMEAQGFSLGADTAHVYEWRKPELMVELHKSLVYEGDRDYFGYYGTGWRLARKGAGFRYDLSLEDSYVFNVVHLAKHYRGSGVGCRHVVDLYVFRQACPELDMRYVSKELKKLHLHDFHENVMRTLDVWFRDREPDPITGLITEHVFSGGSWGNRENGILSDGVKNARKANITGNSRIRAWIRTIFPTYERMAYNHKSLRKFPLLLPVFWVDRWFRILLFRRKNIRGNIRKLNKADDEAVWAYRDALLAVGLEFWFEEA